MAADASGSSFLYLFFAAAIMAAHAATLRIIATAEAAASAKGLKSRYMRLFPF